MSIVIDGVPVDEIWWSGWMTKEGHGWFKTWRKRFWIITPEELIYMVSPTAGKAKGRIPLGTILSVRRGPVRGHDGVILLTVTGAKDFVMYPDVGPDGVFTNAGTVVDEIQRACSSLLGASGSRPAVDRLGFPHSGSERGMHFEKSNPLFRGRRGTGSAGGSAGGGGRVGSVRRTGPHTRTGTVTAMGGGGGIVVASKLLAAVEGSRNERDCVVACASLVEQVLVDASITAEEANTTRTRLLHWAARRRRGGDAWPAAEEGIRKAAEALQRRASSTSPTLRPKKSRLRMASSGEKGEEGTGRMRAASRGDIVPTFRELFELGKKLGEGAYSVVHVCTHIKTGKMFAVKVLERSAMAKEDKEALLVEVSTLRQIRHPNIVRLVAFFDNDPKNFFLVTELCKGGDVFDRVVERERYTESEARATLYCLLDAVATLHRVGIVHRDVKPENILLSSPDPDAPIKLADFGFAAAGNKHDESLGTPAYLAPELVHGHAYGAGVDVWAAGVTAFVLLSGFFPFPSVPEDEEHHHLFERIRTTDPEYGPEWRAVSAEARGFVQWLLTKNPKKRPTASEALKHPWFAASLAADRPLEAAKKSLSKYHAKRRINLLKGAVWTSVLTKKIGGGGEG